MEFRLTYEGPLHAATGSGGRTRTQEKHDIRKQLHPQMRQLWTTDLRLRTLFENKHAMNEHFANKYARCGYRFVPLICDFTDTCCALDILFLRREDPGNLVNGGDLDKRIRTLFDALRMPQGCDELCGEAPVSDLDPFYVLLQDDFLISQIAITTDRLLTATTEGGHENDVKLVILVKTIRRSSGQGWIQ